jgi:hypothetical protein
MDKEFLLRKHKAVSRIDCRARSVHGWFVRVRSYGQVYYQFFADLKNGGRKSALFAALNWRISMESKPIIFDPDKTEGVVRLKLGPGNGSDGK